MSIKNSTISIPSGLIVLLGGARSGKSSLAVELACQSNHDVYFIATAEARDEDMKQRIARHKVERPNWTTIEEPIDLPGAIKNCPSNSLIIIDCLTLWISNLMLAGYDQTKIRTASTKSISQIATRISPSLVISNEVGLGLVPDTVIGREYRDVLGQINQQWVRAAKNSLFLVAGKAFSLTNPKELLV